MKVNKIEEYVHDDNIKDIISDFSIRESKVVLWDADSIVHFVLYSVEILISICGKFIIKAN